MLESICFFGEDFLGFFPNCYAPKFSAPNAWVPLWLCSKKPVPQMPGCPYGCAPSYSAPMVVPLMQCPSFRLPPKNGEYMTKLAVMNLKSIKQGLQLTAEVYGKTSPGLI